ncbi:DUF2637 domain-containing protein [Streptomyces sp. ISL-100]|uniref:DUF2637 domain-containing protein n=1 Tax=Streptomyces sp. ISL-100 TaxID=2819173 RepID=UPI001BE764EC|nr:DUF2637 domain-containing protein [Streptomyces sp. ISL-100]MBT2397487.1 DUF2637 domain-containing protein [Streptomyces sp. ISL-100]
MSEDRITQRTVTVVMAVIALLAFVFSFGNVWNLALRLGIPDPIAPLIAPMVDLSVLGLLVALRYLSLRGVAADDLKGANRLMHTSGFFTLALNIAEPVIAGHYGRACVDAVAPLLLLGWGAVGPALLRHFHAVTTPAPVVVPAPPLAPAPVATPEPNPELVPEGAPAETEAAPTPETAPEPVVVPEPAAPPAPAPAPVAVPQPAVKVAPALLDAAREIADTHRAAHGQPITAPELKARLGVSLPLATAAHAALTA